MLILLSLQKNIIMKEISAIKTIFKKLSADAQDTILQELQEIKDTSDIGLLDIRAKQLDNKQGSCPHCGNLKYKKNGNSKGVQNYKCKSCDKSFTAYTGTWLAHIHKKHLLVPYLKLMQQGLSLDKIKSQLKINKKTAFDWRHKISSSITNIEKESFNGITESDETFFLQSEKGSKNLDRKPRKRGKSVKKRGISDEQVAVIVSTDRKKTMDFKVACFGRISKANIELAIGKKVDQRTVLCTDGHVSYKGFAIDKLIEHHVLKANLKEYVKQGKFHIQHVNSMHSRMKNWLEKQLMGVATKYLQNYMNWFHIKEKYTTSEFINKIVEVSVSNTIAKEEYRNIVENYNTLKNLA
jgi:transposase-like protein